MSWNLRHAWVDGPRLGSLQLSTCKQCGTLRTVDHAWTKKQETTYTRPGVQNEEERVRLDEPPCVTADASQAVTAARMAARDEDRRAAALKRAIDEAPEDECDEEQPLREGAFPWASNDARLVPR